MGRCEGKGDRVNSQRARDQPKAGAEHPKPSFSEQAQKMMLTRVSQHVQHPKLPGILSLDLDLFSPGHMGVSNSLGLIVWRSHAHRWHEPKDTALGLTARKKKVVKLTLAGEDPGPHMWEAIPWPFFLGASENRKGGKTNSGLWDSKMQLSRLPTALCCSPHGAWEVRSSCPLRVTCLL